MIIILFEIEITGLLYLSGYLYVTKNRILIILYFLF